MLLKGMGESFLLSKDGPLTPNMELWHFEFLEGGPKTQKSTKNRQKMNLSILVFIFFCPRPLAKSPFRLFYWGVCKQAVIKTNPGTRASTTTLWK